MVDESSYGIIPVYKDEAGGLEVLLVKCSWYWWFPKWHPEPWETIIQTALRELQEETWIQNIVVDEVHKFEEHYTFMDQTYLVHKYVCYFVGIVSTQEVVIDPIEVQDYIWVPIQNAKDVLTYDSNKKLLDEAMSVL